MPNYKDGDFIKKWERFTKQEIEEFVKSSFSYAQLAEKCGYNQKSGSGIKEMHHVVDYFSFDTTHFTGKGWLLGKTYNSVKYIKFEDYIKRENAQSNKIRQKLLREGIKEHRCECCMNTTWKNVPIPLEVHHKDGNNNNNQIENLQLLCPNCHALTDTYRGRNVKKHRQALSKSISCASTF